MDKSAPFHVDPRAVEAGIAAGRRARSEALRAFLRTAARALRGLPAPSGRRSRAPAR